MDSNFFNFKIFSVPAAGAVLPKTSGRNQRGILVVYQNPEGQPAGELEEFLAKVLGAAKIDLAEDALSIKITSADRISLSLLRRRTKVQYLISFGVPPQRLGLHMKLQKYRPVVHNHVSYLFSDDLQLIYEERQQGGKAHAARLWQALQQLFIPT